MWTRYAWAVLLVPGAIACGDSDGRDDVTVFAAASLADAFGEIEAAFEDAHPAVDIRLNTAGSPTLREQILEGAPADVFAPADESSMDVVVADGAVVGPVSAFATNAMAIGVPFGNPAGITGLGDLADPDRLIGLCAEGVPCGDLGRAVLGRAGVVAAVDTDEPDVRSLRTKLAVGELDAGIVYVSDLRAEADLDGIDIPPEVNAEARYPIAALTRRDGADAFVAFVLSAPGQQILASYGFGSP